MKKLKPYIFSVFLILSGVLFFRKDDVRREVYAQVLQPFEEVYEEICGEIRGEEDVYGEGDIPAEADAREAQDGMDVPDIPEGAGGADSEAQETGSGSVVIVSDHQPDQNGTGDGGGEEAPQPEEPDWYFGAAPEGYFDDALFIGDSRTVGLSEYGGLDQSTFYCSTGLTIYRMFTSDIVKVPGSKKKITVEEALGHFI